MNRVILFRGKRVDTGEWVEGYYGEKHNPLSNEDDNYRASKTLKERLFLTSDIHSFIMLPTLSLIANQDISYFVNANVDPKTVGQYTNLNDKNGKQIFDGDIVKFCYRKSSYVCKISFECGAYGIVNKDSFDVEFGEGNDNFISLWEIAWEWLDEFDESLGTIEVIGNIHDNPELLQE